MTTDLHIFNDLPSLCWHTPLLTSINVQGSFSESLKKQYLDINVCKKTFLMYKPKVEQNDYLQKKWFNAFGDL